MLYRRNDPWSDSDPATEAADFVSRAVRSFAMDRFEVTVGRFESFVVSYQLPTADAGAYLGIPASGWDESWSLDPTKLPSSAEYLRKTLRANGELLDNLNARDMPVRGSSWYIAMAFCIWDGGRLPSEAEWAYAASGAGDRRAYPWSAEQGDPSAALATYTGSNAATVLLGPSAVGSHADAASGKFGHDDLAGNVYEWVIDTYSEQLDTDCSEGLIENECVELDDAIERRVLRGGAFDYDEFHLRNERRVDGVANIGNDSFGFRCVRELPSP